MVGVAFRDGSDRHVALTRIHQHVENVAMLFPLPSIPTVLKINRG